MFSKGLLEILILFKWINLDETNDDNDNSDNYMFLYERTGCE
jgi:hypothetical protein